MFIPEEFRRQFLAVSPVFINDFVSGLGYGWVAPTLRLLQNDVHNNVLSLSVDEASWIASLHDFGRLIGTSVISQVLNFTGRKGGIAISSIIFLIVWILIAFTRSVTIIYWARILFGVSVGLFDVTDTIYVCENVEPKYRGLFVGILLMNFYGGLLVEFCLINYFAYRTVAYINCFFALIALSTNAILKETPAYLVSKGKYDSALKTFFWLRGKKEATVEMIREFEVLKSFIESENKRKRTTMDFLSVPVYRRAIAIVLVLSLLTATNGAPAISSFVSIAFTEGVLTPNEYTILFGAFQFCSVVFGSTIIEKVNRRTILIISLLIATVVHAFTATLFYLQQKEIFVPYFSWWIFATITLYAMMYASSLLPAFVAARGELLPQYVRPFGGAVAVMMNSLIGFLITKAFLLVATAFGIHWNFTFYSVMSFVSVLFVYFVLPETRGKSLMEIQNAMEMKIIH